MAISDGFVAGLVVGWMLLLGLAFLQRRRAALGWGLLIAAVVVSMLGGYVSF